MNQTQTSCSRKKKKKKHLTLVPALHQLFVVIWQFAGLMMPRVEAYIGVCLGQCASQVQVEMHVSPAVPLRAKNWSVPQEG